MLNFQIYKKLKDVLFLILMFPAKSEQWKPGFRLRNIEVLKNTVNELLSIDN